MNNLDTTTPISEFNVVDENGNTTAVPLSAGNGLPAGGTTDQILAKASNANYDTKWVDAPSGGGGSGSGTTKYEHNIFIKDTSLSGKYVLQIINDSPDTMTRSSIQSFLNSNGFKSENSIYPVKGEFTELNTSTNFKDLCLVIGFYYSTFALRILKNKVQYTIMDNNIMTTLSSSSTVLPAATSLTITDTVIER